MFLSGYIYYVNCTYFKSNEDYGRHKYAIALTSGTINVCVFFINSKKRNLPAPETQVLVTPNDIPSLSHDSYIDTSQHKICMETTCLIKSNIGMIPDELIQQIRSLVQESKTITGRYKQQILSEFLVESER